MNPNPKIKFVKKANMWCKIFFEYKDGKKSWEIKWFKTKEEAENYAK